jgi:hypothetical protein
MESNMVEVSIRNYRYQVIYRFLILVDSLKISEYTEYEWSCISYFDRRMKPSI